MLKLGLALSLVTFVASASALETWGHFTHYYCSRWGANSLDANGHPHYVYHDRRRLQWEDTRSHGGAEGEVFGDTLKSRWVRIGLPA